MKIFLAFSFLTGIFGFVAHYTNLWGNFEKRATMVYNYEQKSLELARENRVLKIKLGQMQAEMQKLANDKEYLKISGKRKIASVPKFDPTDLVQQDAYQWAPEKLKDTGAQSLARKEFEKSAQFYNAYLSLYPGHKGVSPETIFEAGVAAYESKKHYDWAINHFNKIVENHKASKLHKGAKLWLALSYYQEGRVNEFVAVCKDFKNKYRNTNEWKIVSKYYESIMAKHDYGRL